MQNSIPPQAPNGAVAPKSAWLAAGVIGTLIVVLLAAVLYKLSVPATPTAAVPTPVVAASMPAPPNSALVNATNPQSAIAVTNANPAAPNSAQFAPLQPTGAQNAQSEQRPATEHRKPSRKVEAPAVVTTGGNGGANYGGNNGGNSNSYAPQTFAPQPVQAPAPAPQAPVCASCGTVASVTPVQQPGQANGVGAVVGGLVGGLLGNQVGGGNGRTAATVIGAIGGGLAGNEVQKRTDAKTVYQVQVRMDDGQVRTTTLGVAPPVGQRVQFGADGGLNPLQ